jgi:hypothetical protein
MRHRRLALFVIIMVGLMVPVVSSAGFNCSKCATRTVTVLRGSTTTNATEAFCVPYEGGDIANCQVIALDDNNQTCTAVNYVSFSNDCYGIDIFQPSTGVTLWTRQIESDRRNLLIQLIKLRRGI